MNKYRALVAAIIWAFAALASTAETSFDATFCDSTLRIDFVLSGDAVNPPTVAVRRVAKTDRWGGRRHNLDKLVLAGSADATVTDAVSGDTLYRHPLCTLFQEWLALDEHRPTAMEGTVLLPMPRSTVNVAITLRDSRRQAVASSTITIDPSDIQIADLSHRQALPASPIHIGDAPDSTKIHVAILAEGYTEDEMDKFVGHARSVVDAIFSHEPFDKHTADFDFVAICSPSQDSGVSEPKNRIWRETAFDSHFSTFNSDRYLTAPSMFRIYDAIANTGCDHIVILANTDKYGGGGIFNFYTITTTSHPDFAEVAVHEFGHSFAGLADEYFYDNDINLVLYPDDIEPWEQNITTQVDFASKWQCLVESGEAGLVEGGGYVSHGVWRSAENCRMRTNAAPDFCPACRRAIEQVIRFYTEQ